MKAREIIIILVLILLMFLAAIVTVIYFRKNAANEQAIKELKENFKTIVNYDSISTAREKQMFDSLRAVREDFKKQIDLQNDENKRLRARNHALEKRFRDLDIGVRPVF